MRPAMKGVKKVQQIRNEKNLGRCCCQWLKMKDEVVVEGGRLALPPLSALHLKYISLHDDERCEACEERLQFRMSRKIGKPREWGF